MSGRDPTLGDSGAGDGAGGAGGAGGIDTSLLDTVPGAQQLNPRQRARTLADLNQAQLGNLARDKVAAETQFSRGEIEVQQRQGGGLLARPEPQARAGAIASDALDRAGEVAGDVADEIGDAGGDATRQFDTRPEIDAPALLGT